MKLIDRYILRELIPPFLTGTFFFTFVLLIQKLGTLVSLLVEKNIDFIVVIKLLLYMMPFTLALSVPMGTIFGILLAYGRLSHDTEITAMKANGISMLRIYYAGLLFGLFLSIFMVFFNNFILPESNFRYKTLYRNILYSNPGILLGDRIFTKIPDSKQRITALNYDDEKNEMNDVFIYEFDNNNQNIKIWYAKKGIWLNNDVNSPLIILTLIDGNIIEINMGDFSRIQELSFKEINMNIRNKIYEVKTEERTYTEIPAKKIAEAIKENIKKKQKVRPILYVELHKRYSFPFACLAFVIIGAPLAITSRRSGKGIGFGFSIIIIIFYYILLVYGESGARNNRIPPILGVWLPNIGTVVIGSFFFIRSIFSS